MIGYIGLPGALQALPYKGGLSVDSDRPVTFTRTMGGKRKAFVGPASRREWSVSFDLIGSKDTNGLVALAGYPGSYLWYPADATAGNMLSPQAVNFETVNFNGTDVGVVALPDGSVAHAVALSGAMSIGSAHGAWEAVPVRAGKPVTIGGWGMNGIRFTGAWRDSDRVQIGTFIGTANTWSGWAFASQTFTPPSGATQMTLSIQGATQIARPSIAWGSAPKDMPGRGCAKAVVSGLSEALTVVRPDDSYGSIDVTISEVG